MAGVLPTPPTWNEDQMSDEKNLDELLQRSAQTDIQVLLSAKESAKRATLSDPSAQNLAALERASKLLEARMDVAKNLKNVSEVLTYIEENGRKVKKTKLYEDIRLARLPKQPDGTFSRRKVDRYMASLPTTGTSDSVATQAADRLRRKEEAEIRRAEAQAAKEEFNLGVKKGLFIPRDAVHVELAGRALTLSASIKTAFEAHALDIISIVEGNPKKSLAFVARMEAVFDEAMSEYSREMDITVEVLPDAAESPDEGPQGEEDGKA